MRQSVNAGCEDGDGVGKSVENGSAVKMNSAGNREGNMDQGGYH